MPQFISLSSAAGESIINIASIVCIFVPTTKSESQPTAIIRFADGSEMYLDSTLWARLNPYLEII